MMAIVAAMSIGLYGFGMSLNDIIDRRRDTDTRAGRPLPSGASASSPRNAICTFLFSWPAAERRITLVSSHLPEAGHSGMLTLIVLAWTATLILFYDTPANISSRWASARWA